MSGLTVTVKRGSRGSDTLLEAANRILRILGVSSAKRGKQPSPKSKVSFYFHKMLNITKKQIFYFVPNFRFLPLFMKIFESTHLRFFLQYCGYINYKTVRLLVEIYFCNLGSNKQPSNNVVFVLFTLV